MIHTKEDLKDISMQTGKLSHLTQTLYCVILTLFIE